MSLDTVTVAYHVNYVKQQVNHTCFITCHYLPGFAPVPDDTNWSRRHTTQSLWPTCHSLSHNSALMGSRTHCLLIASPTYLRCITMSHWFSLLLNMSCLLMVRWTRSWVKWIRRVVTCKFVCRDQHWRRSCTCFHTVNQHRLACQHSVSAFVKSVVHHFMRLLMWHCCTVGMWHCSSDDSHHITYRVIQNKIPQQENHDVAEMPEYFCTRFCSFV